MQFSLVKIIPPLSFCIVVDALTFSKILYIYDYDIVDCLNLDE